MQYINVSHFNQPRNHFIKLFSLCAYHAYGNTSQKIETLHLFDCMLFLCIYCVYP